MARTKGFNLPEDIIFTHAGGSMNITGAYTKVNISEDIFQHSMNCSILLADTTGVLDDIYFDGTETITIAFKSEPEEDEVIKLKFRIYKVDVQVAETGVQGKQLHNNTKIFNT